MKAKHIKRLGFKRWLLQKILGKQVMYVVGIALYKSQKESEMIGNTIRAKYLEEISLLFDHD